MSGTWSKSYQEYSRRRRMHFLYPLENGAQLNPTKVILNTLKWANYLKLFSTMM